MVDLALIEVGSSYRLEHQSIVGLLWLQTHFGPESWDLICSGKVRLSGATREALCADAAAAGLKLCCLKAPIPLAS